MSASLPFLNLGRAGEQYCSGSLLRTPWGSGHFIGTVMLAGTVLPPNLARRRNADLTRGIWDKTPQSAIDECGDRLLQMFLRLAKDNLLTEMIGVSPFPVSERPLAGAHFVQRATKYELYIDAGAVDLDDVDDVLRLCSQHGAGALVATKAEAPGRRFVVLAQCYDDEHLILGLSSGVSRRGLRELG